MFQRSRLLSLAVFLAFGPAAYCKEPAAPLFTPPPRTIADITAILDQEKPDPAVIAKTKAEANAEPSPGTTGAALADFYYTRGHARIALGRTHQAIEDAERAVQAGNGTVPERRWYRIKQFQYLAYRWGGDYKKALNLCRALAPEVNRPGFKGWQFHLFRQITELLLLLGDEDQAGAYVRRIDATLAESQGWTMGFEYRNTWAADSNLAKGRFAEARGRFQEAEAFFKRAEQFSAQSERDSVSYVDRPQVIDFQIRTNVLIGSQALSEAKLGRLAEAEFEVRRSLLRQLKTAGKYHPITSTFINRFAAILVLQGRYKEAEALYRTSIKIMDEIGMSPESQQPVATLGRLAGVLNVQKRYQEAAEVYARLDKAIEHWSPIQKQTVELNADRVYLLFASNQAERGLAAAKALLSREQARAGEAHFDTAVARGILAIGLARTGRDAEALEEFRRAIPSLLAAPDDRDYDDTAWVSARTDQLRLIAEAYFSLMTRSGDNGKAGDETFPLADAVRSQAVHRAVAAASARMVIKDPALAEAARLEQDQGRRMSAGLSLLNAALALPPADRDEKVIASLRSNADALRAAQLKTRAELDRRFRGYTHLLLPRAPSVPDVQASLKDGEALLSFYFGERESFVWAVPKRGRTHFAAIPLSANELEDAVKALRAPMVKRIEYISELEPFDTRLAYSLYEKLLAPVEDSWNDANTLLIVTNGALGQLPLLLLPAEPPAAQKPPGPPFSDYKSIKWLARTHAVISLPSASALIALRALPPGSPGRLPLIGFGDPFFSAQQAAEADQLAAPAAADKRGIVLSRRAVPSLRGVDSADLAMLPRLPDTAEELKAIALALHADPATSLKLGREANERNVMSADLSRYRVVAFSTHGLVGGELNGLTQPALALTAPKVAGVEGDGMLTMEKILSLKLDADWTVLSACNTGAGIGAEAEAASGLGRAFFYAGSRALLVTNWPVNTEAAKDLVSGLFRRQTGDNRISRAEALRQAAIDMIDHGEYKENGAVLFSYAHPLFWAPYTVMGDGG